MGTEPEARNYTIDDLDGRTPDEIRSIIDVAKAQINDLVYGGHGELRSRTADEDKALEHLLAVHKRAEEKYEEHRNIREVLQRVPKSIEFSRLGGQKDDPYADVRRMPIPEARDRALRVLDDRLNTAHLSAAQKDEVDKQVRSSTDIARRVLVTETPEYREAWLKLVTQSHPLLEAEEVRAVKAWNEYRAMSENTTTAGGYGIPVFIDPSIILTAQESDNPFLQICRQENVNTNMWKGVSSAGVSWSFDTEAARVSDDSPTLAQPTVQVHMARGFIPFSIELDQDYPSFASEMSRLLTEGYNELLVDKFTRGTGSGEPYGIVTVLSANTNVRVTVTTAGTNFSANDPYKVWKALPQKFRTNASWLMSVGVNNALRQLGTANVYHAASVNLPAEWLETLFNKQVREGVYMADVTTSTSNTDVLAIVGDFKNFLIARRGGMSVELIPQVFQQQTAGSGMAMPTGQRGWFAYSRIGSNSVNDLGFRALVNS